MRIRPLYQSVHMTKPAQTHYSKNPVFLNQETTLLIVGKDRKLSLEVFQHALNSKVPDAHFMVACLDEDPTQQPPHMPRPKDLKLGSMSIYAVSSVSEMKNILISFSRQDPHSISATVLNKETFETVMRLKAASCCSDAVFIVEATTPEELISKFYDWGGGTHSAVGPIWSYKTTVAEINEQSFNVYELHDEKDLKLRKIS